MLDPVDEPLEQECVLLLCIHHLSSLRSHRPSCTTLLSSYISPHFSLWARPLSPRQPNTVQRGLVSGAAPSDAFMTTTSRNLESPPPQAGVSCRVVTVVVYPTRTETMFEMKLYRKCNYITLCLLGLAYKTAVYTNFIFIVKTVVRYCFPSQYA